MASQKSTAAVVTATQVQRKFGEIVRRVYRDSVHFIVEREGLPVMAIIPMAEYQEFIKDREQLEAERDARVQRFQEAARAVGENMEKLNITEEELDEIVEAARQELYDKKKREYDLTRK